MKPIHACVACALLGQLWLSACGGSSSKRTPSTGDAGAAGDTSTPTAGTSSEAGASGATPGEAGASGATNPGEAGASGEGGAGTAGEGGTSGEGGAGGALGCFTLDPPPWSQDADIYTDTEGSAKKIIFNCAWFEQNTSAKYDPDTNRVTFDAKALGPIGSGKYTAVYPLYGGGTATNHCIEGDVELADGQVSLPIPSGALNVEIGAISLQDGCSETAELELLAEGSCYSLGFYPTQDPAVWAIECYEGLNGCAAPKTCEGFGQTLPPTD